MSRLYQRNLKNHYQFILSYYSLFSIQLNRFVVMFSTFKEYLKQFIEISDEEFEMICNVGNERQLRTVLVRTELTIRCDSELKTGG